MKNIVVIISLMLLFVAKGFGQKSIIYGTTATHLNYKYAYLYNSDTKVFVTAPIIKDEFVFKLDKPEKPKILILSFNTELIKTYDEVLQSPNYKDPNGRRMIALEDTVKVTLKDNAKDALVEGKILNKAIDDMNLAAKLGEYETFFEQHSDSPIALVFLKILAKYSVLGSPLFSVQERKLAYDKLSDRLKNSDEGKELLEIIKK